LSAIALTQVQNCSGATTQAFDGCDTDFVVIETILAGASAMKIEEVVDLQASFVRILVVDDFTPWQLFVQTFLGQDPNLTIIGFASDGLEAVQKAGELEPDLILMDIRLPGLSGIEAALQIQKLAPQSAILFLSQDSDPDVVHAALSAGGRGYILKSKVARDLVAGMEAVLGGKCFVSSGIVDGDDWT
jgi:DNA-binding NarL/FixJ family response regulator